MEWLTLTKIILGVLIVASVLLAIALIALIGPVQPWKKVLAAVAGIVLVVCWSWSGWYAWNLNRWAQHMTISPRGGAEDPSYLYDQTSAICEAVNYLEYLLKLDTRPGSPWTGVLTRPEEVTLLCGTDPDPDRPPRYPPDE